MPMTVEEFWKWMEDPKNRNRGKPLCKKCKQVIDENEPVLPSTKYCPDCYYELLGNEIEKHPIGFGHRGPRT